MSTIAVNAITDANGGSTTSINGTTPNAYNTVGKNLIINGAMQIAQRGTSFTNPSSNSYSVDRFKNFKNTGATFNISQVTSSPDGFSNSVRIDVTATDDPLTTNDYLYPFVQGIEGYNLTALKYGTADAEKLTLSFWVRSNKTGTYIAELQNPSKQTSQSYTINSADTWEKKTVTFVGDTSTSLPADNSGRLWLYFYVAAGPDYQSTSLQTTWSSASTGRATGQVNLLDSTSNYLELTGVQLEVGESATEFEHRSYGTELSLCQRYYYDSLDYRWLYAITTNDSGHRRGHSDYPVTMRATPTVTPTWGQYSSGPIGIQFSCAQGVSFYSDSVPAGSYTNVTFTAEAEL